MFERVFYFIRYDYIYNIVITILSDAEKNGNNEYNISRIKEAHTIRIIALRDGRFESK